MKNTRTIMIVDDDDSFRELLVSYISNEGFNVISKSNGEEAVKAFKNNDIDLFLIDVLLPRKNGFELVKELKEIIGEDEFPLIMMSGFYKGYKHKNDAIGNFGAKAYLEKPFDFDNDLKPIFEKLFKEDYPKSSVVEEIDENEILDDVPSMMIEEDIPIFSPVEEDSKKYEEESELGHSIFFEKEEKISGIFDSSDSDFSVHSLPNILIRLNERKLTGELYMQNLSNNTKKIVYIDKGIPISIKSTILSECLGNILVEDRLISSKDRDKSLEIMRKTKKPQGLVLREMQLLNLTNLKYALARQLEIKLKEIFSWSNYKYQFKITEKLNTPPIIHEIEHSFFYTIHLGITEKIPVEFLKKFYKLFANKIMSVSNKSNRFLPGELFDDEISLIKDINKKTLLKILKSNPSEKEPILRNLISFYFLGIVKFK